MDQAADNSSREIIDRLKQGSHRPVPWDGIVRDDVSRRGLGEQHRKMATERASRLLNGYYRDNRRAWVFREGQVHAVAEHVTAMIDFEADFAGVCLSGTIPPPDDCTRAIEAYLKEGYTWHRLWQTMVDEVVRMKQMTAGEKTLQRIARWAACRSIDAFYPYGRKKTYPGSKKNNWLWPQEPDVANDSFHIKRLIEFEFEFTKARRKGSELADQLEIAKEFAPGLPPNDRRRFDRIVEGGARRAYSTTQGHEKRRLSQAGVYSLFLDEDDILPSYIGKASSIIDAIGKRHTVYWKDREIYFKDFPDEDLIGDSNARTESEKQLLAVFNPPVNCYVDVRHPDEILEMIATNYGDTGTSPGSSESAFGRHRNVERRERIRRSR